MGRVNLDLLRYCRQNGDKLSSYKLDNVSKHYGLSQGKNDMPYEEIFRIYRNGTTFEKTKVAEYCLQDCLLCNQLINKMNVIPNCIGMANTCFVPLNFLFNRGQGIKIYSLLLKECFELGYIIPSKQSKDLERYKGATVLEANQGSHFYPVSVLDFASLYPSSIISHNLCVSTKLTKEKIKKLNLHHNDYRVVKWVETFSADSIINKLLSNKEQCEILLQRYSGLRDICHNFKYLEDKFKSKALSNSLNSLILRHFLQRNDKFFNYFATDLQQLYLERNELKISKEHYYYQKEKGVIPKILQKLLDARNESKKLKKKYAKSNPFLSSVYDGLQLSYKITANSVYGQLGASFCPFGNPDIAASVTATGRQLLELSREMILKNYHGSEAIYGDTDSVFIKFCLKKHHEQCPYHCENISKRIDKFHKTKTVIVETMKKEREPFIHSREYTAMSKHTDFQLYNKCSCPMINDKMSKEALQESIRLASEADQLITSLLPCRKRIDENGRKTGVHQLEYEKTYHPFILFTKKRYVGKLYEHKTSEDAYKLDYKGIVLKRRDNCELLKKVYKKCLNSILEKSVDDALRTLEDLLNGLIHGKIFKMEDFVITKTLRAYSSYKPDKKTGKITQPHVMLAKRVEKRNRGKAFQVNQRVPYCFIESNQNNKNILQGDIIETPEYIKKNKLKLDYGYYIKKQLETPICQLFENVGYKNTPVLFRQYYNRYFNKRMGIISMLDHCESFAASKGKKRKHKVKKKVKHTFRKPNTTQKCKTQQSLYSFFEVPKIVVKVNDDEKQEKTEHAKKPRKNQNKKKHRKKKRKSKPKNEIIVYGIN